LAIQSFVADLNSSTYASNPMAQAACERKFEIIAFRNQLIHGYAKIKATTVWTVIEDSLPPLLKCVSELLDDLGEA